ncbi:MAG TPA: alternative ribosome rescue aminoacyl-tRNA hydrolase ArfB [Anaerolineae bacterium]|nr:alternative ribosome rescue aminoacyl-tRNA hydrolase ArfB [Anaerolineae bacterium]HQI84955.1 alternative ribosome rescue aminoacyl-tRNA hydrolase ArfB [Anaerolineae bacterium]
MLRITADIVIDEQELDYSFVHASGPGGQNVNKVATAVQLRFDVAHSPSLPEDVRQRLLQQAAGQITQDGVLIIDARQYRSQWRNRRDATQRLLDLIRQAAEVPKPRRATHPSRAVKEQRLEAKRQRSETKRLRRPPETE